jgi:hypothetical protein
VLPDVSTNNSSCRDCNTDSRNRTRSHSRPSKGGGLIPALAQELENGQAPLIAANDFPVDQAGPHLQIVHGLGHEKEADQSVPRLVSRRMPTGSRRAIRR